MVCSHSGVVEETGSCKKYKATGGLFSSGTRRIGIWSMLDRSERTRLPGEIDIAWRSLRLELGILNTLDAMCD